MAIYMDFIKISTNVLAYKLISDQGAMVRWPIINTIFNEYLLMKYFPTARSINYAKLIS